MKRNIFLWDKPCELLIFLRTYKKERLFAYKISRLINITQDRIRIILKEFEIMNILKREKEGRRIYLTLTKEGECVADYLIKLKKLLK